MLSSQRGTAVFTALFVVVIASSIAVTLMMRSSIDIRRTQQIFNEEKANQYTMGAMYWAELTIAVLNQTKTQGTENEEEWPKQLPPTLIADKTGVVAAELIKLDDMFNINSIKNDSQKFVELVQKMPKPLNQELVQKLITSISNWISQQQNPDVDNKYLSKKPPYRPARREMVSISELRLIDGVSPTILEQLKPYIVAYPSKAIAGQITPFYLLKTDIKLQQQHLTLYTLLQRITQGGKVDVKVIWQSRGTL